MARRALAVAEAARKAKVNVPIIRCCHCDGDGRVPLPIHLQAVWRNLSETEPRTAADLASRIGGGVSQAGVLYQLRTLVGLHLIYAQGKLTRYRCKPADLWLRKPLIETDVTLGG